MSRTTKCDISHIAVVLLWSSKFSWVKLYTKGNTASFSLSAYPGHFRCLGFSINLSLDTALPLNWSLTIKVSTPQNYHSKTQSGLVFPQVHSSSMMLFPWSTFSTDEKNHSKRASCPSTQFLIREKLSSAARFLLKSAICRLFIYRNPVLKS